MVLNMKFNVGDKIKIIYMDDGIFGRDYNGRTGVIEHIDDLGQLHGSWGGLAVIPEIDKVEILERSKE